MAGYEYEQKHGAFVRENAAECTVLLKKDGSFPLEAPGDLALYGNGARHTIKGGTGSGEVNSRYFVNVYQGLQDAGFHITSDAWLDAYEEERERAQARFVRRIKAEARANRKNVAYYAMGKAAPEPEYEIPIDASGDTAVYVLSRISGEGSDRSPVEGDILLSRTEVRDILACEKRYPKFILVLNVGGVVDLTPVQEVRNILVLSQLGAETGNVLADILLGRQTPSGKLSTTWAAWGQYPASEDFGEKDDTRYREGIYVGYRYFETAGISPLYPFGYGLSYTEFQLNGFHASLRGGEVSVAGRVRNVGAFAGKEVVQLYASLPEGKLDEPYQVLCGFEKTALLAPGEEEEVRVTFRLCDIAPYDEEGERYLLEAGDYVLRVGVSSRDAKVCAIVRLDRDVTVLKAKNVLGKPDFQDMKITRKAEDASLRQGVEVLSLDASALVGPQKAGASKESVDPAIEALTDDQLVKMNLGAFDPKGGIASVIGNAGFSVAGAAGQTSLEARSFGIPSLVMADGPAGLRLNRKYAVDDKGVVHGLDAPFPASMTDFLSKPVKWLLGLLKYKPKKTDQIGEQYATAIPIGTAIAQSFNTRLAEEFGRIVGEEMERFGVHLWLAPALNIHRSIRCGRNFEYFSEDPLVSGLFAAALTEGVQSYPHAGTTIKHYAFNNQERNRTRNNSQLSERAAREIYLKGFGICVRLAQPKAVMTSYNLVNGRHTSEHDGLIGKILREEYGYQGIVMTDWVVSGLGEADSLYPDAQAAKVCMAGGDLFMPGSQADYDGVQKGLACGAVTKRQLQVNATRVLGLARKLAGEDAQGD